jgi:hypothetical protein
MAQIILDSNNNLIQGDFDNATLNNRTKLQTTTTNATTNVYVVPNGSSTSAGVSVANNSSLTNASKIVMATNGTTDTQIISGVNGSGSYLPLSFYTNNALAGQFDTSGNFGVGTVSPSVKFQVAGGSASTNSVMKIHNVANSNTNTGCAIQFSNENTSYFMGQIATLRTDSNVNYSSYMTFSYTNNTTLTEGMRLDSSGNLLVGTTTANARITSQSSNNNASSFALWCMNSSSTQLLKVRDDGLIETGTATNSPYNYTTGSAANTFINSSGQFQRSTSSLKYKQNVQDATHGLSDVLKLRPVTFTSKNDESGTIFGGLIAEEVHEAGLTEFVQYSEDGSPDALAYANMVSLLTKAIQEQQTIINELKSRIEALESK